MGNVSSGSAIGDLAFSPDGGTLAFREYKRDGTRGLGFLDLVTGERSFFAAPEGYRFVHPTYSPSGQQVAVALFESANQSQIAIMDVNGENLRELTTDRGCRSAPSFSADGQRVIFIYSPLPETGSTKKCVKEDVYEFELSTGETRRLTNFEFYTAGNPFYLPDGQRFIFYGDGPTAIMKPGKYEEQFGENYIFIMDGAHNDLLPAISGYDFSSEQTVSRDGKILFKVRTNSIDGAYTPYNYDLFVRIDGQDLRLTKLNSAIGYPVISPDGKKVAFLRDQKRNGNYELMIMSADGSGLRSLGISGRLF